MFTTGYPHQGTTTAIVPTAGGYIPVPVQHCFYQAHPPNQILPQPAPVAVNQQPSIASSNISQPVHNPGTPAAAVVFEASPSETRGRDPPAKAPLASDIVKGVASAPKTAPATSLASSSHVNNSNINSSNTNSNESSAIAFPKKDVGNSVISHDPIIQQQVSLPLHQSANQNVVENPASSSSGRLDAPVDPSGFVISPSSSKQPFSSSSLVQTTQMMPQVASAVVPYKFGVANAEGPLNTQNTSTPQLIQAFQHARNSPIQHLSHRFAQLDYGSNFVPSHLVMSPGYQKHPFVTHIPFAFVENANALTEGAAAMPNLLSNQLSAAAAPALANTVYCSNCGKQGHLSQDCGEKTINGMLNYG